MKNSKELTQTLCETMRKLELGDIGIDAAKQINHAAGRLIKNQAVQMAYNKQIGKPERRIDFME